MIANCVDCGEHTTLIARRLCKPCYQWHWRNGTIDSFSRILAVRSRRPILCECTNPLVERLGLWDAAQCLRCNMKITDERLEELGK
jgi:hypothetical protein